MACSKSRLSAASRISSSWMTTLGCLPGDVFCILNLDFFLFYHFVVGLRDDTGGWVYAICVSHGALSGNRGLHRIGHGIRIEYKPSAFTFLAALPNNLDGSVRPEESFLVSVENADKPDLGISRPSRERLIPTSRSNLPSRSSRKSYSVRSSVWSCPSGGCGTPVREVHRKVPRQVCLVA